MQSISPVPGSMGYDGTAFALKQTFGQGLQVYVDAQCQVATRDGCLVVRTVLIASLDTAMYVTEHDLHAFFSAQLFFVGAFNTQFADVVPTVVEVVFVVLEVVG